jgi:hypothetical protein
MHCFSGEGTSSSLGTREREVWQSELVKRAETLVDNNPVWSRDAMTQMCELYDQLKAAFKGMKEPAVMSDMMAALRAVPVQHLGPAPMHNGPSADV